MSRTSSCAAIRTIRRNGARQMPVVLTAEQSTRPFQRGSGRLELAQRSSAGRILCWPA